jgi:hypothetical protein
MENIMTPKAITDLLVKEAIAALRRTTGLEIAEGANAEGIITIKKGKDTWRVKTEVKPWLNTAAIALYRQREPKLQSSDFL